jgi:thymidylate kinase
MVQISADVEDCGVDGIEALRSIAACSCKRSELPPPAAHWNVEFRKLDLTQTKAAAVALRARGYRAINAKQASDAISLIFARSAKVGLESVGVPAPLTEETGDLLRCSRGLLFAVFGPDGVGKSSIISATVNAFGPFFEYQRMIRWRPQLISSRIAKEPHKFKLPHDASLYGPMRSMMKLSGTYLDFLIDHATLTRNQLRGSSLIAWDRYFHDIAVDRKRYRYHGPAWYSDLLLRSFPVPERFLGVVLDADEHVMLNRKHELPMDELRRQRAGYQRLAATLPATYIVKNDGDFGCCLQEVISLVIDKMASWFEPVVDTLLESPDRALHARV